MYVYVGILKLIVMDIYHYSHYIIYIYVSYASFRLPCHGHGFRDQPLRKLWGISVETSQNLLSPLHALHFHHWMPTTSLPPGCNQIKLVAARRILYQSDLLLCCEVVWSWRPMKCIGCCKKIMPTATCRSGTGTSQSQKVFIDVKLTKNSWIFWNNTQ